MSNHTPGPWRYETDRFNSPDHDGKSGSIVASDGDWLVAEICGDCINSDSNARLISAAPDLLEAARRALKAIEDLPPRFNEDRYEPLMMLSKAIAKAEGTRVIHPIQ